MQVEVTPHPSAPGRYLLKSPYSPRIVAACKSVLGMTWNKELHAWVGYLDAMVEFRARFEALGNLPIPDLNRVALPLRGDCYDGLRAYQRDGMEWVANQASSGCILADVMGAGKSAQAIRAARALSNRTIIVCPSFVRGVWRRELEKWWPGVNVWECEGVKGDPKIPVGAVPELIVLCHYDILHAHIADISAWLMGDGATLILDEAHYIANEKSRRSRAVRKLAEMSSHRIALTGTPMTNRPRDLWNLVDTISPGRFGGFFGFCLRYANATQKEVGGGPNKRVVWDFSGASNLDELRRRLSYFMLRRTHADIALELPPLTRQVVEVKVPTAARIMPPRGSIGPEMRRALDIAADAKLPDVVALVQQHVEDGNVPVVFCHRRAVAEHIALECGAYLMHGGLDQKARDIAIANACLDKKPLVATIDTASVGIDLTFANVAVFAELSWEGWKLRQAEARLFRFGQTRPVMAQYVVALGTGDELVRDGVIGKMKLESDLGVVGADEDKLREALDGGPDAGKADLVAMWEAL